MSTLFLLKFFLTPLFVGSLSLAGRRWGPAISGWLVGLPLTSGPVVLFLALDQGRAFASAAAQGALIGLVSLSAFCLAYGWVSHRGGWLLCLLAGWCAFLFFTILLRRISVPLAVSFGGVVCILVVALYLLPDRGSHGVLPRPPGWEIYVRMFTATAMVLVLTAAAQALGPRLSGLLTPFPVVSSVLAGFTHHFQGAPAALRLLRGLLVGLFSFAAFFLLVAATISGWGIAVAFGLATLAVALLHGISLWLVQTRVSTP